MSERQIINRLGTNQFEIFWEHLPEEKLTIDFQPLIKFLGIEGQYNSFCMVHYQAKPKGLRRFGVLHGLNYHSVREIEIQATGKAVMIDELSLTLPPNGVLWYNNSKFCMANATSGIIYPY